jgi:hypothetical protein
MVGAAQSPGLSEHVVRVGTRKDALLLAELGAHTFRESSPNTPHEDVESYVILSASGCIAAPPEGNPRRKTPSGMAQKEEPTMDKQDVIATLNNKPRWGTSAQYGRRNTLRRAAPSR